MTARPWWALVLLGCGKTWPTGGDLMDTGWFTDTDVIGACTARVVGTTPTDGAEGWYWRDPLTVLTAEAGTFEVRLTDDLGRDVPVTVTPDASGQELTVSVPGGLDGSTGYTLDVADCAGHHAVGFTTSEYGIPLAGGAASLEGRTYELGIAEADVTWVEPAGFGALLGSFFDTPILLGVRWADEARLDWLGAQGLLALGEIAQDDEVPTWNFPIGTFAEAPFFVVQTPLATLVISGYDLPIYSFYLEGTFTADGDRFGGAVLKGLGDTRYAGGAVLLGGGPNALCNLARGVGVDCQACPDGEVYCLNVELHDLVAREVPGLTLRPVLVTP